MKDIPVAEKFLHLDNQERREIIETLASQVGRDAKVLEKDVWVCWVLSSLFSMPNAHRMAFKGGTSLSKIYRMINRFSEDVDITIDYQELAKSMGDDFDPFLAGQTRSIEWLRTLLSTLGDLSSRVAKWLHFPLNVLSGRK